MHAYYNSFVKRQEKLTDYQTNPNIALVSYFMCAETDEEARRRADGATFFQFALRFYGASSGRKRPDPYTVNMWDEYNKWKRENPEAAARAISGGLIGSPETLRRKLRRFQTSNIDQVILLNQAGKNAHEHICESLELFAKEVMPEFHANEPAHQEWKQQGAGARDRAGRDRHAAVPRPVRAEHRADPAGRSGVAAGGRLRSRRTLAPCHCELPPAGGRPALNETARPSRDGYSPSP